MAYTDLVTQIANTIKTVPNTGPVHKYVRYESDWETFSHLFSTTINGVRVIRGWQISRVEQDQDWTGMGDGQLSFHAVFRITGILALNDVNESELEFQELIDSICAALDLEFDYGGLVENWLAKPTAIKVVALRQFGSVLCHYTEIILNVGDERTVTQV